MVSLPAVIVFNPFGEVPLDDVDAHPATRPTARPAMTRERMMRERSGVTG